MTDFLDSNVLLYLFAEDDPGRRDVAQGVVERALMERGSISHQVVQEVIAGMLRGVPEPLDLEVVADFLRGTLTQLWRVQPSEALYLRGMEISRRYRFHFYDALIIAAALEAGCARLLTEDMQDGQRIDGLVIENPFRDVTHPA